MVCAVFLLMSNSSADVLSFSHRSGVSICCGSSSIVSLPSRKRMNHLKTVSAHSFPPVHLHQHFTILRSSISQFVAGLDVYTLLHWAVTLPLTLTKFNWPQSVYTSGHVQSVLCVDSPHVSEEPYACAHICAKLPLKSDIIHRAF